MTNTRIAERLSKLDLDSVVDRSEELPALTEKFQNFAKGFKPLTEALKTHYDAMKTLEQTQAKVRYNNNKKFICCHQIFLGRESFVFSRLLWIGPHIFVVAPVNNNKNRRWINSPSGPRIVHLWKEKTRRLEMSSRRC